MTSRLVELIPRQIRWLLRKLRASKTSGKLGPIWSMRQSRQSPLAYAARFSMIVKIQDKYLRIGLSR